MGEFALYNGNRIKIGVCRELFYLRYEDRNKVTPSPKNVDPTRDTDLFFRLPFPDEDAASLGDFTDLDHTRSVRLYNQGGDPFIDPDLEPGHLQLRHACGLLFSVPCYHGQGLPKVGPDIGVTWNGRDPFFLRLRFLKLNKDDQVLPTVWCGHCHRMWTYDWEDVWDYIPGEYQERFAGYKEQAEKYYSLFHTI